ncbi:MAG: fimbrillin family protein [Bacteroidaceae bacterium]|nr:fimbrillin family protein [Bacteroidaceae bacterium]
MKTKYLAFAASLAWLASCSNDDVPQDNLKDTPITVTAGVAELTTRAGYVGTNVLPETFYLSIDQTVDTYDYYNVLMKNVSGAWKGYEPDETTEKQLLWANGTDKVSVTAATFSFAEAQTLMAEADQSTADGVKKSDHLLMAATDVTPSSTGISVNFSHIMSKVILTITLGDEFNSETNPITDVKFMETLASRSFDHTAETKWSDISDATTTDIIPLCNAYTAPTTDKPNATAEYEVILIPQTVAANGFTVIFNVGDRLFKWTSESAVTLEGGYKYTLDLTAGKDIVSSATFSASAWNTGEGDDNKLNDETE